MGNRTVIACVLGLTILGTAACSGEAADQPSPTATSVFSDAPTTSPPTTNTPTATATAVDISAVPDTVTPAYVDEIMRQTNARIAEIYQQARDEGTAATPAREEAFTAVATLDYGSRELRNLDSVGTDVLAPEVTPASVTTTEVREASDACILAIVDNDTSGLFADPSVAPPSGGWHLQLVPAEPTALRPWPWRLSFLLLVDDGDPQTCAETDAVNARLS